MGYMHINNLYKNREILFFKECYALEKIHGTSAHISWNAGQLTFYAGGESHANFVALFDQEKLKEEIAKIGQTVVVYGEAYGGKQQGMRATYGDQLKFIVFDVKLGDNFVAVPYMDTIATKLGLEVVHYVKIPTDLEALDRERDAPSVQAKRNGIVEDKPREGVVLRPITEFTNQWGERVIVKHKGEAFQERQSQPKVVDTEQLKVLEDAEAVALEWVVENRLDHVLQKLPGADITLTGKVAEAMLEDVYREAKGEIVESKAVATAIKKRTTKLFHARIKKLG